MDVLDEKERERYAKAIGTLIYVIQHQENGLREHDEFLGDITYHYPKAPEKPITFASYKNLPVFGRSAISIRRAENDSIWSMARISLRGSSPEFLTEFSRDAFSNLGLVFLRMEAANDDKNKYFVYQTGSRPAVLVKFYVEASHLGDGPDYPKNFKFVDFQLVK